MLKTLKLHVYAGVGAVCGFAFHVYERLTGTGMPGLCFHCYEEADVKIGTLYYCDAHAPKKGRRKHVPKRVP